MVRRPFLALALAAAAATTACGPDAPSANPPPATDGPGTPERQHVAQDTSVLSAERTAELQALVDALHAAADADDWDAVERAKQALLAEGPDAVAHLLEMMVGAEDWDWRVSDVLLAFRDVAVPPLCALLQAGGERGPGLALAILGQLGDVWPRGPHSDDVVRALAACVRGYDPEMPDADLRRAHGERAQSAAGLIGTYAGPAGRVAAAGVARLWLRALAGGERDCNPYTVLDALESLGSSAGPAAPILLDSLRDVDPVLYESVFDVLAAIGSAEPSTLPRLRELLGSGDPALRIGAIRALRSWSDVASPADDDLLAILGGDTADEDERDAAAIALAPRHALDERVWRVLLESGHDDAQDLATLLASDEDVASAWIAAAPTLDEWGAGLLEVVISEARPDLYMDLAESLLECPWPDLRAGLVWPMVCNQEQNVDADRLAELAVVLLADPEPSVRIEAASFLHSRDSAHPRALAVARSLRAHANEDIREAAHVILDDGPRVDVSREAYVAALATGGDEQREAAVRALAKDDEPIGDLPAAARSWLTERLLDGRRYGGVLVRTPGGVDVYIRRMREILARSFDASEDAAAVLDALRGGGGHALELRSALTSLTFDDDRFHDGDDFREEAAGILAEYETDAMTYALSVDPAPSRARVERLLALESSTRDALVLFAGRGPRHFQTLTELGVHLDRPKVEEIWDDGILGVLPDAPVPGLLDSIRRAARATGEHAETRRRGAALLALRMPERAAVELLAGLARDPDGPTCVAAFGSLRRIERLWRGSVPPDVVSRGLGAWETRGLALTLAGEFSEGGYSFLPALRDVIGSTWDPYRVRAAAIVWRITGSVAESAGVVRSVLAAHERVNLPDEYERDFDGECETDYIPWDKAAAVLAAAEPEAGDVALVCGVIPPGDPTLLLPLLERHAADAAAAVPTLRTLLAGFRYSVGARHSDGEAAARLLASIGPAARAALPDLRRWIAQTGDVTRIGREAVRRIESGD